MTLGAFAWGGVWLHSFAAAFTHPVVRAALASMARDDGVAVVLGASLGFEAYVRSPPLLALTLTLTLTQP